MIELIKLSIFLCGLWQVYRQRKNETWFVWVAAQIVLTAILFGGFGSP